MVDHVKQGAEVRGARSRGLRCLHSSPSVGMYDSTVVDSSSEGFVEVFPVLEPLGEAPEHVEALSESVECVEAKQAWHMMLLVSL